MAVADAAGDPHGVAGALEVLPNVEALIEVGVDYAVVALPTEFHAQAGQQLAAAGVHALIEKPLAKTTDEARALASAFSAAGLIGAVGHIERYNACLLYTSRCV